MAFDEKVGGSYQRPPMVLPAEGAELPEDTSRGKPVDGRVEITYDPEGMLANMTLYPPENGGRPLRTEKVVEELHKNGVVFGIDEFDIKDMIEAGVYETAICVARAQDPVNGKNGFIKFRYDKERKTAPKRDEFGMVDFRELDKIVPIRKGDVIADITPPTEGTPGKNIFGKPIPAQPGKAPVITVGKNTAMTVDGLSIVSSCDGHIVYGAGCFNVEDTVTIKSDLDLEFGNITFFGDIVVKGNVMEGFKITAGGSVRIDGTAFNAEITAGKDITIIGGAINCDIDCEGNASIGFCENSRITTRGDIESKQFAFCDIFCYGALSTKGARGMIVGGKITSMRDINAGIIGSEKYTQTEINIGDGSVIFSRKRKAEKDLSEANEQYEAAVRNIEYLQERKIRQGGHLDESQQKQMRGSTQNKLFYGMRRKELSALIEQLNEDIRNKDFLSAKANVIYPGARFCVNFLTLDIVETVKRAKVTIVDDKLAVVPN